MYIRIVSEKTMTRNTSVVTKSLLLFISIVFLFSCTRITYFPQGNAQTGLASWYGSDFHGKKTSCKEIYDMHALTAAHKTLPFQSHVKVTNLNNGKNVTVRINDRGPFVKGRIIDLSFAAAQRLGMVEDGVVPVRVQVLSDISPKKSTQKVFVLVGSFLVKKNADILKKKLQKNFENVHISRFEHSNLVYHRVIIKTNRFSEAEEIAQRLFKTGFSPLVMEAY